MVESDDDDDGIGTSYDELIDRFRALKYKDLSSSTVPPSLNEIKVFLARGEELDRERFNPESRVVAYNARQYAVLIGTALTGQDGDAKTCLRQLLNQLEKEKEAISGFAKDEHWKICRKVADRVFGKADEEDRAGIATKRTAKSYNAAGTFYEVLQQSYEEGDDIADDDETKGNKEEEEKRRVYCKWKATDILNAIKHGRTPAPGGFMEQYYGNMDIPSISPVGLTSSSITQDLEIDEEIRVAEVKMFSATPARNKHSPGNDGG